MNVLILGAGFGGLELASSLSEKLGEKLDITLIDSAEYFMFGFSKLDVMFGKKPAESTRMYYRDIVKPGVDFRQEKVVSIDPDSKHVVTDQSEYNPDILVVALGADYDISATPGLKTAGLDFYSAENAENIWNNVHGFDAGTVVIGIMGSFYKCPPAPSETAFLLYDEFLKRGVQENTKIIVVSSLSSPVPLSKEISDSILTRFKDKNIEFVASANILSVDEINKQLVIENNDPIDFDLLLAVPKHVAPKVIRESKLATDGWVKVNPYTLETDYPGIYGVGDVTETKVPRAGVFAEGQAKIVADQIINKVEGTVSSKKYNGAATCYVEYGDDSVARMDVDFLSEAKASGKLYKPDHKTSKDKALFAESRRKRWFGSK